METALTRALPWLDPDVSLICRMAAGDEEALRALYVAHGRQLLAYAIRLTGSPTLAEEVLQDSLLGAWRGAAGFRGEARVITWLLGIVHRQALNATRRRQQPLDSIEQAAEVADHGAGPEACVEAGERGRALGAALAELSPEHRAALELVFYQGLSLAEAAEVCSCPTGTIKSRLSYAKAHLRKALARAGWQAEDMR